MEARALGSPVGAADTEAAAEVETCGEACSQGDTLEAPIADAAAAEDV